MADRIPMTPEGKEKLIKELAHLKSVDRPYIVREIETARAQGDLSENAEYHAAKEKQGHIETRIQTIEDQLGRAEVIDLSRINSDKVVFGVTVRLFDPATDAEVEYRIVGDLESDIEHGLIAISSPIAKALIGKAVGDEAIVRTPGGTREFEVIDICVSKSSK